MLVAAAQPRDAARRRPGAAARGEARSPGAAEGAATWSPALDPRSSARVALPALLGRPPPYAGAPSRRRRRRPSLRPAARRRGVSSRRGGADAAAGARRAGRRTRGGRAASRSGIAIVVMRRPALLQAARHPRRRERRLPARDLGPGRAAVRDRARRRCSTWSLVVAVAAAFSQKIHGEVGTRRHRPAEGPS